MKPKINEQHCSHNRIEQTSIYTPQIRLVLQSQNKKKAPKIDEETNKQLSLYRTQWVQAFTWKSISSSDIICFCTSGVTSKGITYKIELQMIIILISAAWLAQLGERRSAELEVAGSYPGRTSARSGTNKGVFTRHRGEFRPGASSLRFPLMALYLFTWYHHKMSCRRESPRREFTPVLVPGREFHPSTKSRNGIM